MFNIEGLIPKLCLLAQEIGDGERVEHLHAASLQALSAAVCAHYYDVYNYLFPLQSAFFAEIDLRKSKGFICTIILCLYSSMPFSLFLEYLLMYEIALQ